MRKVEASVRVENVVASVNLNQRVDLEDVVKAFPSVKYQPETFPGVVFRLKRPKTATLIFRSGRMVCTGAKSERGAVRAVLKVVEELKKAGIIIAGKPDMNVQNIVATANLNGNIDLEISAHKLRAMYEPERFPGMIYRMEEPKVTILIFSTGKLVCAGAKKESEVRAAVGKLHQRLEDEGLIY